ATPGCLRRRLRGTGTHRPGGPGERAVAPADPAGAQAARACPCARHAAVGAVARRDRGRALRTGDRRADRDHQAGARGGHHDRLGRAHHAGAHPGGAACRVPGRRRDPVRRHARADARRCPRAPRLPRGRRRMSALSVRGLDAGYGDFQALFGVGLDLASGETVALVGANGAGKTTLLSAIAGALRPWAGSITVDGTNITTEPDYQRARSGVVLVPEGRRLFGSLTVEENILVPVSSRPAGPWTLDALYDLFPIVA